MSDDDLPIVGAIPGADNVFVATGHGANGLLLGPVTGRMITDMVLDQPAFMDPTAFTPARFA